MKSNPHLASKLGFLLLFGIASGPLRGATPPSLAYASFLGLGNYDTARAIAVDAAGNVWVAGTTIAASPGSGLLPQGGPGGQSDIFVAQYDATGTQRLAWARFGGSGTEQVNGLAMSADGVWLAGATDSSDFPLVQSSHARGTGSVAWIAKLNLSGNTLLFSDYLGGESASEATGLTIDGQGATWVCGWTDSTTFPRLASFADPHGDTEAFVVKLSSTGQTLASTAFGGSDADMALTIAALPPDSVLVGGTTYSLDFPTANAEQNQLVGASDGFLVRLHTASGALTYATYLGGDGSDAIQGISPGATGTAWLCGVTRSKNWIGGVGDTLGDAFLIQVDAQGARQQAAGLGGTGLDSANALTVAPDGAVWITGVSMSDDLPIRNAWQSEAGGDSWDAFVARYQPAQSDWDFVTWWGSSGQDEGRSLVAGGTNIFLAGTVLASRRGLPFATSADAAVAENATGYSAGFWARLEPRPDQPGNDALAQASELKGSRVAVFGWNHTATAELGEPNHAGQSAQHSVWWTWRAPENGAVVVSTEGSGIDTVLSIYQGLRSWSTLVVENDDDTAVGGTSRAVFIAEAGADYTIAVDGKNGAVGPLFLSLSSGAAPNDDFRYAAAITSVPATVTVANPKATPEPGEPPHGDPAPNRSVWWRWTAPANMDVSVDVRGSEVSGRPYFAVYTGDTLNHLQMVTSDNSGNRHPVILSAQQGITYSMAVDVANGGVGTVRLDLALAQRLANDDYRDRVELGGQSLPYRTIIDLRQATREPGERLYSSQGGNSAWWSWSPSVTGNYEVSARGTNVYPWILVYRGNPADTTFPLELNTGDPMTAYAESRVVFRGVAGQSYAIALDSYYYGEPGPVAFTFAPVAAPPNDDLGQAIPIGGSNGSVDGTTVHASRAPDDPLEDYTFGNTVWYAWQAPADGNVSFSLTGGLNNLGYLQVFQRNIEANLMRLAGFRPIYVNDNCPYPCIAQETGLRVQQGETYFVEIAGASGAGSPFQLHWQLFPILPNDDFASASQVAGLTAILAARNTGASVQERESQSVMRGANGGHSLWWQWTAPSAGLVEFTITNTGPHVLLDVYLGDSLDGLTRVASNALGQYGPPYTNRVSFATAAGVTYRISLDTDGATGEIQVGLEEKPALHFDSITRLESGQVRLEISGATDRPFRLESSPDLGQWTTVTTLSLVEGHATFTEDTAALGSRRFYRMVEQP